MKYRPLPEFLTIDKSNIDGLGLFAVGDIEKGVNAGITHIEDPITKKLYRTPLGGFINHSEEPNCELMNIAKEKYLITKKDIMPNEELTLKYTMYEVENYAKV
jgi:hypothetical protein